MASKRGIASLKWRDVDFTICEYDKLSVSFVCSSDTSPLLNSSSSERLFETMGLEIEQLLSKVSCARNFMSLIFYFFGYLLFLVLFIPLLNMIILNE